MSKAAEIEAFLSGSPFAVVGASRSRDKYGNKALRAYRQAGREVFAVNPHATDVEGQPCWPDLAALPERPHGISIVTPPDVTRDIVTQAIELGVRHLWMQPGAEDPEAVRAAERAQLNVIHSGPCILVALGYREG